jgi:hypothetical protein
VRSVRGVGNALANESLLVVVFAGFLGVAAILVPYQLSSDGWFALVAGRFVAHHGLPHHDSLAALTAGREWVDQQWLGHLAIYGVGAGGGLRLVVGLNVLLVVGAFGAACAYGRRRGGQPTTVALITLLGLLPFAAAAFGVRAQSLVYLPFVVLVALLLRPTGLKWVRTFMLLALVVIWANVHGSVLLAAGLVSLRGAVELIERRTKTAERQWWLMLVGPWVCLIVSPYQLHVVSYYARTAFNSSFATYLSQWAPTTFSPISATLLVLAFATVWVLGRAAGVYSTYERCLLVIGVLLAFVAVRQWAFAALLLIMLVPVGMDSALRKRPPRRAPVVGAAIAIAAGASALAGIVVVLSAPVTDLTRSYPNAAADLAAAAAARSGAPIYGGVQYSDWLLWRHPELAGRVVFDVRYELLRRSEVKRLVLFDAGSGIDKPLGKPGVFVLDPDVEKQAVTGLRPDVRTVYNTDHVVVAVKRDES